MGTPNYPQDFGTGWSELRRRVTDGFTSGNTRKALTEIRTSVLKLVGDMVIKASGRLVVEHLNGRAALTVGRHTLGGEPVSGIVVRRPDGSTAMWMWGDDTGRGFWSLWDQAGHIVVSDDDVAGVGLARPYIPYFATPTARFYTASESTTNTTATALWTITGRVQHPKITVRVLAQTPAGTTGQVRLRDPTTGVVIAGPVAVPANGNYHITLTGANPDGWDQYCQLDVEAWRTAGTGAVRLQVLHTYGVQSGAA